MKKNLAIYKILSIYEIYILILIFLGHSYKINVLNFYLYI